MSKIRKMFESEDFKRIRGTAELVVELTCTKGTKLSNAIEELQKASKVQNHSEIPKLISFIDFDPELIFDRIVSLKADFSDIVNVMAFTLLRGTLWLDGISAKCKKEREFYSPACLQLIKHLIKVFQFPRETERCYQANVLTPTRIILAFPVLAAEVQHIVGSEADSLGVDMPFRYAFYGGAIAILFDKWLDGTMEDRLAMIEKYKEWIIRYCTQKEGGREPTMEQANRYLKVSMQCAEKLDIFEKKLKEKS